MEHFEKNNCNQMLFLRINELMQMIRENIFCLTHIVATRIQLMWTENNIRLKYKNQLTFLHFLSSIFQYFSSMSFPAL